MPFRLLAIFLCLLLITHAPGCDRAQAGKDEAKIELELWTWALRPWFDDYMHALVADFERQYPQVDVIWVDIPADAMRRKMFAVGAAGRLPDVINFSEKDFPLFASLGALHPLDGIAPTDPRQRYIPGALDAGVIDGKLLGVPWYLSTPIRLMNTSLLAEGGLTPQTLGDTWPELLAQARPFHEKTGKYLFTLPLGDDSDLPLMLLAEGIEILQHRPDGGWESHLTDPQVVAYVRRWVDLYRDGAVPRAAATEAYSQMVKNYVEGRAAMINGDATRAVKQQAPAIYAVSQVGPGITGGLGKHTIAATFVSVSKQTKHPRWAAKLAWHMTSPKWQERLAKKASRVPGTRESLEDIDSFLPEPAEGGGGEGENSLMRQAARLSAEQMRQAESFAPPIGAWPDLRKAFDAGIKRALLGGEDVEQVLAEVNQEWNRILRNAAAGMPYK